MVRYNPSVNKTELFTVSKFPRAHIDDYLDRKSNDTALTESKNFVSTNTPIFVYIDPG